MNDQDSNQLKLKKAHKYFAQIQGQMAIGERPWCDLVVYTFKGAGSRPRTNFCLVARDLYLRNYC